MVLGEVKVLDDEEDVVLGEVKVLDEVAATCEVEVLNADNDGLGVELGNEVGKEVEEDSPPADTAGTSSSVSSPEPRLANSERSPGTASSGRMLGS